MFEDVALRWKDEFLQLWLCFFKSSSQHVSIVTVESAAGQRSTKHRGVLDLDWFKECCCENCCREKEGYFEMLGQQSQTFANHQLWKCISIIYGRVSWWSIWFALRENTQISTKQSGKSTNIATINISAAYDKQIRCNLHLDSASESSKNHFIHAGYLMMFNSNARQIPGIPPSDSVNFLKVLRVLPSPSLKVQQFLCAILLGNHSESIGQRVLWICSLGKKTPEQKHPDAGFCFIFEIWEFSLSFVYNTY